jgi:tol-pal system protein YbgF
MAKGNRIIPLRAGVLGLYLMGGLVAGGMASGAALLTATPARAQAGLNYEVRISTLEDQVRQLNGRIEELNNTVSQLKSQLDRAQSDNDVRFNQLQGGGGAGSAPQLTPPPSDQQATNVPLPPQSKPPQGAGADISQPPSRSGNLGTLAGGAAPPQQQAAAGGGLPPGNATDQYNYAMGLLSQANYPAAEQAMKAFVDQHPKDPLAGNAQYWLGETFYVRKDYNNAATAFAQGYEKYPKSPKAADDLLKLGMSLTALNQKADACKVYGRLERDFPTPPQSIKERITGERQRAGC